MYFTSGVFAHSFWLIHSQNNSHRRVEDGEGEGEQRHQQSLKQTGGIQERKKGRKRDKMTTAYLPKP